MNHGFDRVKAAEILKNSISSVFAEMAFIDVMPADGQIAGELESMASDTRKAVIDVLLPLSCRLELAITGKLLDRIVETLFIDEPESVQRKNAEDTLLEILNIIAGQYLSTSFGQGVKVQLELPRYVYLEEDPADPETDTPIIEVTMNAEGQLLKAAIVPIRYRY